MKNASIFHVKKRTLLAIAGCVWFIAGLNVARLGVLSYQALAQVSTVHVLLSVAVFCAFGSMFRKMSRKHNKRIQSYPEAYHPVWHFFDLTAYIIMAVMMGGGIWLRYSGLVPNVFIAVFYTGLGCALVLCGILIWIMFFKYENESLPPAP